MSFLHRVPMFASGPANIALFAGILLAGVGCLLPVDGLVGQTTSVHSPTVDRQLTGALLFKGTLVVLGLFVAIVGRLPLWTVEWSSVAARERHSKRAVLTLSGIVIVATILRLHQLDSGLWLDEIYAYVTYVRAPVA